MTTGRPEAVRTRRRAFYSSFFSYACLFLRAMTARERAGAFECFPRRRTRRAHGFPPPLFFPRPFSLITFRDFSRGKRNESSVRSGGQAFFSPFSPPQVPAGEFARLQRPIRSQGCGGGGGDNVRLLLSPPPFTCYVSMCGWSLQARCETLPFFSRREALHRSLQIRWARAIP